MLKVLIHLIQLLGKDLIASRAKVDKLDLSKLVNVPTRLNNSKTNLDDLDIGKSKAVPAGLKQLSNVVFNEVVKNTKFNILKKKLNNLEKNLPIQLL